MAQPTGRARAEALSRSALESLDGLGIDDNIVGHVTDMVMVAPALQERAPEARQIGRLPRREGDELRLLDTTTLKATLIKPTFFAIQ